MTDIVLGKDYWLDEKRVKVVGFLGHYFVRYIEYRGGQKKINPVDEIKTTSIGEFKQRAEPTS
jgi:hypothetical protein